MRRFKVYLNKNVVPTARAELIVEMPDDATDKECDETCAEVLDTLIENEIDTGWYEVEENNAPQD